MRRSLLCVVAFLSSWILAMPASAGTPRVPLPGHVPAVLSRAIPAAPAGGYGVASKAAEPMVLTLVLRRRDRAGFERALADTYDPRSPTFRRFLTPATVSERFGPDADDYAKVRDYFVAEGFVTLEESPNRLTVRVLGTRAQVEKTLAVQLRDFTLDGRAFTSNTIEPSLPADIAARVEAVVGLNGLAAPQRLNATFRSLDRCMRNADGIYSPDLQLACTLTYALDAALYDIACAFVVVAIQLDLGLTTGIGGIVVGGAVNRITGCHFVYPGGPLPTAPATAGPVAPPPPGSGQKVGIVAFDSYRTSDIQNWFALVGFAPSQIARLSRVDISGGAALGPDQDEVVLDVAQVMFLAPGADVTVYSMPPGLGSFQSMFNRMLTDGMDVVSNSWAYCESQTSLADVSSLDSVLASMALSGITVLNASGDSGSTCLDGSPNTVTVPASSPRATAVGGSSYTWGPAPLYGATERWWDGSSSTPSAGQGGFGTSRFFARPVWQDGFSGASGRSIPDVVAAADPVTNGKAICVADAGGCPTGAFYGGTSVAAPLWAAVVADLNAGLGTNLGFLNPQLYALNGTPALHGAGELASDFAHVGLGSPNVAQLYVRLSGQPVGAVDSARTDVAALPAEIAADGVSSGSVVVQLRDARGLPVAGRTVSLAASAGVPVQIVPPITQVSSSNGTMRFAVRGTSVGVATLQPTDVGSGQLLDVATLRFVPPPATSGSIAAFPTSVQANGTNTTTITINLRDARGLPAVGKRIRLSAGGAQALVTGPSPPITDAQGQILFIARNQIAQSVVFSAIDETDGELQVPGSATVAFVNSTNGSCAGVPIAAAGWSVAAFATGFFGENFFYGGVNWGGCPGASNPTFDTAGNVFIASFRTGDLFRFGFAGGVATSPLSNGGITLGQPVLAADGRLYAALGAASNGASSGAIIEIDPGSGATLRTVASGLSCPSGLAVDPLGGDLFFVNQCTGGGLDNASLYRLTDPAGTDPLRPTAVVVYATLPESPNGVVSFSPDGTLYAAVGYSGSNPRVVRVSATTGTQPPTLAPIAGLSAIYWVNVAEVNPDGSARSLLVLSNSNPVRVQLADLSTTPPTLAPVTDNPLSTGTIGPDGCLYTSGSSAIYRITPQIGPCRFRATNPSPALLLSPSEFVPQPTQGGSVTFAAQLSNAVPPAGMAVAFQSLGANEALGIVPLDASGRASFVHTGLAAGLDDVRARIVLNGAELLSNPARVLWGAGIRRTAVDLALSLTRGGSGRTALLRAALLDLSATPPAALAGATLAFSLGSTSCQGTTDAQGIANCSVVLPAAGTYTLAVSYAGASGLSPSSASRLFLISDGGLYDDMFKDGFE